MCVYLHEHYFLADSSHLTTYIRVAPGVKCGALHFEWCCIPCRSETKLSLEIPSIWQAIFLALGCWFWFFLHLRHFIVQIFVWPHRHERSTHPCLIMFSILQTSNYCQSCSIFRIKIARTNLLMLFFSIWEPTIWVIYWNILDFRRPPVNQENC